jgi:hypothetical protein
MAGGDLDVAEVDSRGGLTVERVSGFAELVEAHSTALARAFGVSVHAHEA